MEEIQRKIDKKLKELEPIEKELLNVSVYDLVEPGTPISYTSIEDIYKIAILELKRSIGYAEIELLFNEAFPHTRTSARDEIETDIKNLRSRLLRYEEKLKVYLELS